MERVGVDIHGSIVPHLCTKSGDIFPCNDDLLRAIQFGDGCLASRPDVNTSRRNRKVGLHVGDRLITLPGKENHEHKSNS